MEATLRSVIKRDHLCQSEACFPIFSIEKSAGNVSTSTTGEVVKRNVDRRMKIGYDVVTFFVFDKHDEDQLRN